MAKASGSLQDLRRGIYVKAKAEPSWRFWGLYVHVCKMETLRDAYALARKNHGAPGIDGVNPTEPKVRAPDLDPTDERGVETGLWLGYLGTARRKGRQQTNQPYGYRARSRLYRTVGIRGEKASVIFSAVKLPSDRLQQH